MTTDDGQELTRRLDALIERLDRIDARLDALEARADDAAGLRAQLEHERRARTDLAEQTRWLIDMLGDSRAHIARLRDRLGDPQA